MGEWMSETRQTTDAEGLQGLIRNPSAEGCDDDGVQRQGIRP